MDLRSLEYFIQTANSLSFTQAAKACFVSQSAISLAIAKLEEELGFQLFVRNNRVIGLTRAGEDFYRWSLQILRSYDNITKECRNIDSGYSGEVNIAFTSYFDGQYFLPELKAFKEAYPQVQLNIMILPANFMRDKLKTRDLDVAVCWPRDFQNDDELEVYDLCNMHLILAVNALHPFASMEQVPAELLFAETCYMLSASRQQETHSELLKFLRKVGFIENKIRFCSHAEDVIIQLEIDKAIALVPDHFRHFTNERIVYKDIDIKRILSARLSFCCLKDNQNSALELLRRSLKKHSKFNGEQPNGLD